MAAPNNKTFVFSEGPAGPTRAPVRRGADIKIYADRLGAIGHVNIRIGETEACAIPYEEWEAAFSAARPHRRGESGG